MNQAARQKRLREQKALLEGFKNSNVIKTQSEEISDDYLNETDEKSNMAGPRAPLVDRGAFAVKDKFQTSHKNSQVDDSF